MPSPKTISFFQDRLIFVSFILSAILNIILWLMLAGKFGWSGERVPLHFNVVYGIDYLASARQVYQIPLAGLALLAINALLAMRIYPREKLFSYFLGFGTAALQLILIVSAVTLIVLNA